MNYQVNTYRSYVARHALKEGHEVYATKAFASEKPVKDYRLLTDEDVINVEKALFIIKGLSKADVEYLRLLWLNEICITHGQLI